MNRKKKRAIFNWSGGKDSSLALYYALKDTELEVCCLLSTFNASVDRLSMHGVRRSLMRQQAENIGLPLSEVNFPEKLTMKNYDSIMRQNLKSLLKFTKATSSIFGDIFLEDLRAHREKKLAELDLKAIFPLWQRSTRELAREFIELGFKAKIACVSSPLLDERFVGREYDHNFLNDLPENIDPCGENGEFHTFVYDGPIFKEPVACQVREKIFKPIESNYKSDDCDSGYVCDGFWYCDIMPLN